MTNIKTVRTNNKSIYDARVDSTVEQGVKDIIVNIAKENKLFQSDIIREAIYEGLNNHSYNNYNKNNYSEQIDNSATIMNNDDTFKLTLNVAIPKEAIKCL